MKFSNKLATAIAALAMILGLSAFQSSAQAQTNKVSTTKKPYNASAPKAPWTKSAVANSAVDSVYRQEWLKAESKATCPIIALPKSSSAQLYASKVRRANFASGWGVAYDLPDLRSAYGVANAGTFPAGEEGFNWPYDITYKDGSTAGYGHKGGKPGADWLAYIVLPESRCFYNVWSAQGKEHLEQMIADLRLVK